MLLAAVFGAYLAIGVLMVLRDYSKVSYSPSSRPKRGWTIFALFIWPLRLPMFLWEEKELWWLRGRARPQMQEAMTLDDVLSDLSKRRFWSEIDPRLLERIAGNASDFFRERTENKVNGPGEVQLVKNVVAVSEEFGLVEGHFIRSAKRSPDWIGPPLCMFSYTLYHLGSDLCKKVPSLKDPKEMTATMVKAEAAFTSAVLCDPVNLTAYAGMVFLLSGRVLPSCVIKDDALGWCRMYKDAEKRLLLTPDEELSPSERGAKREMTATPAEREELKRVYRKIDKLPEFRERFGEEVNENYYNSSLRQMIDRIEAELLGLE